MKAICPGHDGPVEVPMHLADVQSKAKVIVFNCPICEEEVLLTASSFSDYEDGLKEIYAEDFHK
ncbi:hypothetical protein [Pedobacter sp. SYSU D00535]|uniref:hypothetical protein n=1 Tax=Pedobacter sp. SYSU D00535 TaxID=2810308 RepID=UPI001A977E63|nr:hypothetical protein [Pedobacter sp. SYSU D00535]